jgi:ubiquinone/menaquinone biosynthesis C-methylase UbiE
MTMFLAERVGPEGRIYANDIDREALDKLASRSRREGFDRIEIIQGESEDPLFPEGALDMVFMINVYHHADDPVALVRNAIPALKPEGILVIVECDPGKVDWAKEHHCTGKDAMPRQLADAGYEMIRTVDFLSEDTIYLARPVSSRE